MHCFIVFPFFLKFLTNAAYTIRVLKRIFGSKRDEVTGECRKLHNEALNDLYFSPNIVRVIKSRIMRWAGHVERMGVGERRVQGFGGET